MIVRKATKKDFPYLESLMDEFYEEDLKIDGLGKNTDAMYEIMLKHYKQALVLETEGKVVGVLAGEVVKFALSDAKLFHEQIWYVSKKYRRYGLKLLYALEKKCKDEGIKAIIMGARGNEIGDKLEKIYERQGYKLLEKTYLKELI